MRVLKISQTYYPFLAGGGPPTKVRALAKRLANRGHSVTVLTADLGFTKIGHPCGFVERDHWGWHGTQDGVEAIYLRTHARWHTLTLNSGLLSFCRQALGSFEVIHIYGLYDLLGPAVGFHCRRLGIPYLIEPMGMYRPIVSSLRLKRLYHSLFGQNLVRGAHFVIATSEQEQRELVEGGIPTEKVVVRRNGIEVPESLPPRGSFRNRYGILPETKLILFLGRLVPKKSPDLLVEAFARWRGKEAPAKDSVLVLAGPVESNGYRKGLEALAVQLGLRGRVLFPGALYDEPKWAAYCDADVFVLPSQNENFGNTAAEAVACGTPVIVTDRCGIAPLVDQRAGLVVAHDRSALEAGLARLLDDNELYQRLRVGGAQVARALDWDEPLDLMETLYAKLVAEGQRR